MSDDSKKPESQDSEKTAVLTSVSLTNAKNSNASQIDSDPCFILIRGQPQGHRFFLKTSEAIVGRDASADFMLAEASVSKKHARISRVGSTVQVTDLGSSNGTLINGKKIVKDQTVTLSKEDMVTFGKCVLKFLPPGHVEIQFYGDMDRAKNSDPLTQIYNKGFLLSALDSEFKRAKALSTDLCILFFDLDHFKKTNDSFGHEGGDFVLKEFSKLVLSHVREKDIFARYGGEEFVIILVNTSIEKAAEIAETIRGAIETHAFVFEGKRIPVTTSLGVAELTSTMESVPTLIKAADQALYASKKAGRNRVTVAS